MDSFLVFGLLATIIVTTFFLSLRKTHKNRRNPPEAGGAWPIIGHLHLLAGGDNLPHKIFGNLADKYGPIFMLKLGLNKTIVVSDWKMAKECFTTNDKALATRPKSIAVELMGYNYAMFGLSPYGDYWREVRKISVLELLSSRRIEMLRHIRESEVKESLREVYNHWQKNKKGDSYSANIVKMEMKHWFGELVLNIMRRMVVGKKYSNNHEEIIRSHDMIRKVVEMLGTFVVSDVFPFLRLFDIGRHQKAMKETAKDMDDIVQGWLVEHKQRRQHRKQENAQEEEEDFMDVMLSIHDNATKKDQFPGYDADTVTKATCMAIVIAGTDTSAVTLTWALSLLLNDGKALKKIQDELDSHVGRERWVDESDLTNLPYLQAVIKETLRLYPAAPLSAPHQATEDCVIAGYNIPKGTRLLPNIWKIHRDPSVWTNPNEFIPDRFLTTNKDVDMKGQSFELVPFGSGRRMCPGASLALRVVPLALASLLQGFEVSKISDELIDMSESFGLANLKATPLEVLLEPRLSSNLYE